MSELAAKLARRNEINGESESRTPPVSPAVLTTTGSTDSADVTPRAARTEIFNPYTEFPDLTRDQIKSYKSTFEKYNESRSGYLSIDELKKMMEKLGHPQTHLGLKSLMKEIDTDEDGQISFKEFLMIFMRSTRGEGGSDAMSGLIASLASVNVSEVGVSGAKSFFEAKANRLKASASAEEEIKREQEQKKKDREEASIRKKAFNDKLAAFNSPK